MVNCPNCDAVIDVDEDELDEGDTLTCDECGADLRDRKSTRLNSSHRR